MRETQAALTDYEADWAAEVGGFTCYSCATSALIGSRVYMRALIDAFKGSGL